MLQQIGWYVTRVGLARSVMNLQNGAYLEFRGRNATPKSLVEPQMGSGTQLYADRKRTGQSATSHDVSVQLESETRALMYCRATLRTLQ